MFYRFYDIFALTKKNAVVKFRGPESAVPPTQIFLALLTDNFNLNRQSFIKANSAVQCQCEYQA